MDIDEPPHSRLFCSSGLGPKPSGWRNESFCSGPNEMYRPISHLDTADLLPAGYAKCPIRRFIIKVCLLLLKDLLVAFADIFIVHDLLSVFCVKNVLRLRLLFRGSRSAIEFSVFGIKNSSLLQRHRQHIGRHLLLQMFMGVWSRDDSHFSTIEILYRAEYGPI